MECNAETGKALENVFLGSVARDWMSSVGLLREFASIHQIDFVED